MTNQELQNTLSTLPKEAIIFSESDHGQCSEQSGSITVCTERLQDYPYYGEDLNWRGIDAVNHKHVTAIRIR